MAEPLKHVGLLVDLACAEDVVEQCADTDSEEESEVSHMHIPPAERTSRNVGKLRSL
jgi:hypothetical protein